MKIDKCKKLCALGTARKTMPYTPAQALDHGLILEKVHKVIMFNQEAGL